VPTFVFELGSPVHRALVGYKAAVTPAGRELRRGALAAWLRTWLRLHTECLHPSCDELLIVPVPSSAEGRPSWSGQHPLVDLCRQATEGLGAFVVADVLRAGERPPSRLQASRHGYGTSTIEPLAGRNVVVVDDIFVSGSRLLSAAAALTLAGARVAGAVPVGRLVRPDHSLVTAAYWRHFGSTPVDRERCSACRRHGQSLACGARRVVERIAA
jgi:hypothetical protein